MAVMVLVNRNGINFDEAVNYQSNPVVSFEYATNFALGWSCNITLAEPVYQCSTKSLQHIWSYNHLRMVCALFLA